MDSTLTPPPEGILDPSVFGQLPIKSEPTESSTMPPPTNTTTPSSPIKEEASDNKKQTKKRKSWGQVLPEPKTNLPPRKRAKTDDEKEQRRVERVLRNRRAAQSSRERKRLETEQLEHQNQELRAQLAQVAERIKAFEAAGQLSSTIASALEVHTRAASPQPSTNTVDPSALSPLAEEEESTPAPETGRAATANVTVSPVLTQRPAETLLFDLPCPGQTESRTSWSSHPLSSFLTLTLMMTSLWESLLEFSHRPSTQCVLASSSKRFRTCNNSLQPTPRLLANLISLLTTRPTSRTSVNSSTTDSSPTTTCSSRPQPTPGTPSKTTSLPCSLRLKTLRKILTCNALLARPLQDATLVAMRLLSDESSFVAGTGAFVESRDSFGLRGIDQQQLVQCLRHDIDLPSREVLMALYWAIQVESKKATSTTEKRVLKGSNSRRLANGSREAAMKKKVQDRYRLGRRSAY